MKSAYYGSSKGPLDIIGERQFHADRSSRRIDDRRDLSHLCRDTAARIRDRCHGRFVARWARQEKCFKDIEDRIARTVMGERESSLCG